MYTVEWLEQKIFKELKVIAFDCGVVPSGDRRCRQVWIDALVGVNFPLLETSPGVDRDEAALPIEVQAQEPIELAAKTSPGVDRDEAALPIEIQRQEPIEYGRITGYLCRSNSPIEVQAQEPIELAAKTFPGVDRVEAVLAIEIQRQEPIENSPGVTFSARFLARYSPPQSEKISYNPDSDGQLSLFDFEVQSADEPPDPDDFDSIDDFYEAMARWDSEHPEPPEVSLASMCEWAPCPEEWFLSDVNETVETVFRTLETSPVSVSSGADESSSTSNFSIPVFDIAADRPNRNFDEPPFSGVGVRRPKPKPPSFPPAGEGAKRCPCGAMPAAQCDGTTATHIYPDRIVFTPCYKQLDGIHVSSRAPPGGDAMQ